MSQKKQDLISHAEALFKQFGFRKVSVEEICRKAKVSKVTFYKYFKNKTELVMRIIQTMHERMSAAEKEIRDSDQPYSDRFGQLFQLHIREMRNMGSPLLEDMMNPDYPEVYGKMCQIDEQSMQEAQCFFEQGQKEGLLNPEIPTDLFMLLLEISREWVQDPRFIAIAPDTAKRLELVVQILFYGIQGNDALS